MKKQLLIICIAVGGTVAVSCGGPSTPRAGRAVSYDYIPPGERVTANIDGRDFDVTFTREDVMLNHDEHGTSLHTPNRDSIGVPDHMKTNEKAAVENHE